MHYILGGNKVGAPPPKKSAGQAAKQTTTFAKISSSLASNGAAAPATVKTVGAKAGGVDAAEMKKLKDQIAEL